MNKLKMSTRLVILIGLLSLLLVTIGSIGLIGTRSSNAGLQTVYEDRTMPMGQIAEIQEKLLIFKTAEQVFTIHLGTYADREQVRTFRNEPFLAGKKFEISARKVSPRETWYRITAGPFATEGRALESIQELKKRGLLPFFPGARIGSQKIDG